MNVGSLYHADHGDRGRDHECARGYDHGYGYGLIKDLSGHHGLFHCAHYDY